MSRLSAYQAPTPFALDAEDCILTLKDARNDSLCESFRGVYCGLRADMVERQSSMKSNLYTAEEGMQHRNKLAVSS